MKLEDITTSKDEATQYLKDVGLEVCEDGLTVGEIIAARYEVLTYKLLEIATELDARELSSNSVISDLQGVGWKDLCDKGIEILKLLKGN
jgi:hypothetical protein